MLHLASLYSLEQKNKNMADKSGCSVVQMKHLDSKTFSLVTLSQWGALQESMLTPTSEFLQPGGSGKHCPRLNTLRWNCLIKS